MWVNILVSLIVIIFGILVLSLLIAYFIQELEDIFHK